MIEERRGTAGRQLYFDTCYSGERKKNESSYSRDREVQRRAERICESIHLEAEAQEDTPRSSEEFRASGEQAERKAEMRRYDFMKEEERERRQKRHCAFLAALALILLGILTARSFLQRQDRMTFGTLLSNISGAAGRTGSTERSFLILVNKTHALPGDYEVELQELMNGSCSVAEGMYDALREMLTDGSTDGRSFVVASGYRDRAYQQQLLDEDIAADMERDGMTWQEAYDKETRETMPPGYSEHETGLAVDLVAADYQVLDGAQEFTRENQWLQENCSKYGFILRYPRGKEEITGIDYEPWHFRYVGKKAAQEITGRGITLEEYLREQA